MEYGMAAYVLWSTCFTVEPVNSPVPWPVIILIVWIFPAPSARHDACDVFAGAVVIYV